MAARARILAIDEQLYFRSFLEGLLSEEGYEVCTGDSLATGVARLRRDSPFDLVITDLLPDSAAEAVSQIRSAAPDAAVLVLSGAGDVRAAVAALRAGAFDYLTKPADRAELLASIEGALASRAGRDDNARLIEENLAFLSRLSLHERALPLFQAPDPPTAGRGVLELLAVECAAGHGALWLRDADGSGLGLVATRGEVDALGDTISWKTNDQGLDASVRGGQIVDVPPDELDRPSALFVPFLHEGELFAVARLAAPGRPDRAALEVCQKLGTAVLAASARVARLGRSSLIDETTGLPTRAYLARVLGTEVQKAHRFGRRLACLCIEIRAASSLEPASLRAVVDVVHHTLRTTDTLCSEANRRLWVLVADTDSLGGVVLKRRLGEKITEVLRAEGAPTGVALGVASYPLDAESAEDLIRTALSRVDTEKTSVVHELGLDPRSSLAEIAERLLRHAESAPASLVPEAAQLLISELSCRPGDRGLLFLAPGHDASAILGPLSALGDIETSTEVFIATDGDTLPSGAAMTPVALPPDVSTEQTWMVRFGEAAPYALVAGPPRKDGSRPVFHSCDPILVEQITFSLRSEVGFGVRG